MKKNQVRLSQRVEGEGHGILVIGEERFQVPIVDIGLGGMRILAPKCMAMGMEVVMEVSEEYGVDAYICKVVFCQENEWGWQLGLEIVEQDERLLVIQIA
ncbi:MAG: PilZ domain-containing protein [Magnetococcales bacterium]|nr:PilZ domain-containing protein [Magnetococcales bacterium]